MREQELQSKIIKYLTDKKYYVVKVVSATKAGVPDIIGCTPKGDFFAIEVKLPGKKPTLLQIYNKNRITRNLGKYLCADTLEVVKKYFK